MLIICSIFAGSIAMFIGQRGNTVLSRFENFIDNKDIPFQLEQAYIAVSTGGIFGEGPGQSNQKNFLPQLITN